MWVVVNTNIEVLRSDSYLALLDTAKNIQSVLPCNRLVTLAQICGMVGAVGFGGIVAVLIIVYMRILSASPSDQGSTRSMALQFSCVSHAM